MIGVQNVSAPARRSSRELLAALLCVTAGVLVAAWLAPKDSYFLGNLLTYWGPHAAIFVLLSLKPPRPALYAGTALAMAAYLAAFGAWLFSRGRPESMAWLGYLFSFPGAVVGVVVAYRLTDRHPAPSALTATAITAAWVAAGLAFNQALVCSTVMYCLGK